MGGMYVGGLTLIGLAKGPACSFAAQGMAGSVCLGAILPEHRPFGYGKSGEKCNYVKGGVRLD